MITLKFILPILIFLQLNEGNSHLLQYPIFAKEPQLKKIIHEGMFEKILSEIEKNAKMPKPQVLDKPGPLLHDSCFVYLRTWVLC